MKTKKTLNLSPFYDLESMEETFRTMAGRGWFLKEMKGAVLTYEVGAPRDLHYRVCRGGEASVYMPEGDHREPSFRDHAGAQGYTYVCGNEKLQVYETEQEKPGSFHVNAYDRIEGISQAAKPALFLYGTMILLGVLSLLLFFFKLKNMPVNLMASSMGVLSPIVLTILSGYFILDMISYFLWKNRADVAATRKEFAPVTFHCGKIFPYVLIISAAILFFGAVTSGGAGLARTFLFWTGGIVALLLVIGYVRNLILDHSEGKKGLSGLFSAVLVAVLTIGVILAMNSIHKADAGFNGSLPVTAQDIGLTTESENLMDYSRTKASFLLRHTEASQVKMEGEGNYSPLLSYELVDSRMLSADGYVLDYFLSRMADAYMLTEEGAQVHPNHYEELEPGSFGAERVWQVITDGEKGNVYLMLFENRLAEIGSVHALTDEQLQMIGEKLAK